MGFIEKAMKLSPEAWNIVFDWGCGLYKSGRHEEALEALHRAQELRGLWDPLVEECIGQAEKALASQ